MIHHRDVKTGKNLLWDDLIHASTLRLMVNGSIIKVRLLTVTALELINEITTTKSKQKIKRKRYLLKY